MKTVHKLFSVCLFVCILNVALCEESVDVNVSNTPSEPSVDPKFEALMNQMRKKLEAAEKEVKEVTSKFETYKKSQEAKLKGVQSKLREENQELQKLIKKQEKQIATLKTRIVELKESQKDINPLQLAVDVTERKILPASEKLLAQAKELCHRSDVYVKEQWTHLLHFLETDATCQKAKRTTRQYFEKAKTQVERQWEKISPKVNEAYTAAVQYAAPYYERTREAVMPTLKKGRVMGQQAMKRICEWSRVAFSHAVAALEIAFTHSVAALEAAYVWLKKTCAKNADLVFYSLLVVIAYCVLSLLVEVAMLVVCLLLCPLRWLCPCCRKKCACGVCCH